MLTIDIWSDIACPWCYVGKRRLDAALAQFEPRDRVRVRWHAFELDRFAPKEVDRSVPYAARLAKKYGTSTERAEQMIAHMTEVALGDGIEMDFGRLRAGNTFDAHRLLHLAGEYDQQHAMKERLMRAYFTDGVLVSDPEALRAIGLEQGLDASEVDAVVDGDRFAAEVREDEDTAAELGIHGVPFFVFANRLGVSGAQPVPTLIEVLHRAQAETDAMLESGSTCEPEGCN